MTDAFTFPAWAAVLFAPKPAPSRADLPTTDAQPIAAAQAPEKRKKGRLPGTKLTDEQKARIGQGVARRNREKQCL